MKFFKKLPMRVVLAVILIWLTGFVAFCGHSLGMKPEQTRTSHDAIIVLTGGANERIEAGLELFARGDIKHLFISGVHPEVSKDELLGLWQGETPLPACCSAIEQRATTTLQNAQESAHWVQQEGVQHILLVTSNYHMQRALLEFRAKLPNLAITPYPIDEENLKNNRLKFWRLLFSEYHKIILRWVQLL